MRRGRGAPGLSIVVQVGQLVAAPGVPPVPVGVFVATAPCAHAQHRLAVLVTAPADLAQSRPRVQFEHPGDELPFRDVSLLVHLEFRDLPRARGDAELPAVVYSEQRPVGNDGSEDDIDGVLDVLLCLFDRYAPVVLVEMRTGWVNRYGVVLDVADGCVRPQRGRARALPRYRNTRSMLQAWSRVQRAGRPLASMETPTLSGFSG